VAVEIHRDRDRRMTKSFLDDLRRHLKSEHLRRRSVPQRMKRAAAHACAVQNLPETVCDLVRCPRAAIAARKHVGRIESVRRGLFATVTPENIDGARRQVDYPFFAALWGLLADATLFRLFERPSNRDHLPIQVDVGPSKAEKLAASRAGGERNRDQGSKRS